MRREGVFLFLCSCAGCPEKTRTPFWMWGTIEKSMKNNDFGLFGPSSVASWRPLGASWKLLGLFGRSLGRLGACVRRFGALLDPPRDPRSHQGAPRGAPQNLRGAPKSPQELPGSPRELPGAPKSPREPPGAPKSPREPLGNWGPGPQETFSPSRPHDCRAA